MSIQIKLLLLLFSFVALTTSCRNGPKVVTASAQGESAPAAKSSGIFDNAPTTPPSTSESAGTASSSAGIPDMGGSPNTSEDIHTITVKEVLPTSRYIYLNVSEGSEEYWVATRLQDVKKGEKYYFRGGLLKTNFESKEYNRIFEKVYLVSNLVSASHGVNQTLAGGGLPSPGESVVDNIIGSGQTPNTSSAETGAVVPREGSIKIADLVKDPKKYEGQTVQITGKCTKVNPNIMNRNWIHLQDGSQDDFDMVVTSNDFVHEGQVVTMRAVVGLERDFGAGYKYNLILEDGVIVQ